MTIVELYDEKPINNIVGVLAFKPDKVVYIGGFSKKHFENKKLPVLRKYFERKGFEDLTAEYVQVRRDSLKDIIDKFEEIYAANNECKFHVEVTGGEDLILIGLGILFQRHPEIELYQISPKLRTIRSYSLDADDGAKLNIDCINSVEENLFLHGASIISSNGCEMIPNGFSWGVEFLQNIDDMWSLCCKGIDKENETSAHCYWNKITSILSSIDSEYNERTDKNTVDADKDLLKNRFLCDFEDEVFYNYIYAFVRYGLMDFKIGKDHVRLSFKNDQIRMCLTKAGLILELKTYLICSELLSSQRGDCLTGVTIDWDGEDDLSSDIKYLYDDDDPSSAIDTTNEIDVLANFGLLPYFISCKNGKFTSEELYKLYSVSERFGKGYGVKIIVAACLENSLGAARKTILQRAADMGIIIVDNVNRLTDDEFSSALRKAMELPNKVVSY